MSGKRQTNSKRADRLLERICAGADADGAAANELLKELFRGYPLGHLKVLLCSTNENAAKAGAWIASELGEKVTQLIEDLVPLLAHPSRYVRFYVLDAVLNGAKPKHGIAIAKAIQLVNDSDDAVRWKALNFVAKAAREQLAVALPHLDMVELAPMIKWLLGLEDQRDKRKVIVDAIDDHRSLRRRFGVAAAARFAGQDRSLLEHALSSKDADIRSFAESELRVLNVS